LMDDYFSHHIIVRVLVLMGGWSDRIKILWATTTSDKRPEREWPWP